MNLVNIPLVRIFPIKTFQQRLTWKLNLVVRKINYYGQRKLRLKGARVATKQEVNDLGNILPWVDEGAGSGFSNALLKMLNKTTLADRHTILEIPLDIAIYNEIFFTGNYSPKLTYYIKRFIELNKVDLFIDIGSNCGLVTRSLLNQLEKKIDYILVEPFPDLMNAARYNLSSFNDADIVFNQFALGKSNGSSKFYREINNAGSGTTDLKLGSISPYNTFVLAVRHSGEFFAQIFAKHTNIVIKSDLQGDDAQVLSFIPDENLRNIKAIVCELWSNPEVDKVNVSKFLEKFSNGFSFYFLDSEKSIPKHEVERLWLDGDQSFALHKYGIVKDLIIINNN